MTDYTTPHSLPIIQPTVDRIKDSARASALADALNALATTTNAAISAEGGRAEDAAKTAAAADATTKANAAKWMRGVIGPVNEFTSPDSLPDGIVNVQSGGNATLVGLPEAQQGFVLTVTHGTARTQLFFTYNGHIWQRGRGGSGWDAWDQDFARWDKGEVPSGTSLDTFTRPGSWGIPTGGLYATLTGTPDSVTSAAGVLTNLDSRNSAGVFIQYLDLYSEGGLWRRSTFSVAAKNFTPWQRMDRQNDVALANSLRVQDFKDRRGGTKKTGGLGAVALRFDHGLANFNSIIRPLLEARNLPYSLALNSRTWDTAENAGVTAAMVDAWVAGGLAEVWNHGSTHTDATNHTDLHDRIVKGKAELQAQLPSAKIDGWVVPGVGGTGYAGFGSGNTPEAFYATTAGRLILEHHAVSTGNFAGTHIRRIDGEVRQGQAHATLDAATSTTAINYVKDAQARKGGLQLMLHPSTLNGTGNITTATLTTVLDHIVAERDAGRLAVFSPYELLLADAT